MDPLVVLPTVYHKLRSITVRGRSLLPRKHEENTSEYLSLQTTIAHQMSRSIQNGTRCQCISKRSYICRPLASCVHGRTCCSSNMRKVLTRVSCRYGLLICFVRLPCYSGGGGGGGTGGGDSGDNANDSAEHTEFAFRLHVYKAKVLLLQEQARFLICHILLPTRTRNAELILHAFSISSWPCPIDSALCEIGDIFGKYTRF